MKVGAFIGSVIKLAILCGVVYALWKFDFIGSQGDENTAFAERSCADAIRDRFDAPSVNVYSVKKSEKGYVVRASITVSKDTPAKVICLTNEFGGAEEIRIIER